MATPHSIAAGWLMAHLVPMEIQISMRIRRRWPDGLGWIFGGLDSRVRSVQHTLAAGLLAHLESLPSTSLVHASSSEIPSAYYDDARLDDALSSSPRGWLLLPSKRNEIGPVLLDPSTKNISCPLPWYV
jgi:hypothetical protein